MATHTISSPEGECFLMAVSSEAQSKPLQGINEGTQQLSVLSLGKTS